jgi:mevalonate pyrophosphate decarboxylase
MYGGWVAWNQGVQADGTDSLAEQVADEAHWPDMRVLIAVVRDKTHYMCVSCFASQRKVAFD